jgi:hypothetical protein
LLLLLTSFAINACRLVRMEAVVLVSSLVWEAVTSPESASRLGSFRHLQKKNFLPCAGLERIFLVSLQGYGWFGVQLRIHGKRKSRQDREEVRFLMRFLDDSLLSYSMPRQLLRLPLTYRTRHRRQTLEFWGEIGVSLRRNDFNICLLQHLGRT